MASDNGMASAGKTSQLWPSLITKTEIQGVEDNFAQFSSYTKDSVELDDFLQDLFPHGEESRQPEIDTLSASSTSTSGSDLSMLSASEGSQSLRDAFTTNLSLNSIEITKIASKPSVNELNRQVSPKRIKLDYSNDALMTSPTTSAVEQLIASVSGDHDSEISNFSKTTAMVRKQQREKSCLPAVSAMSESTTTTKTDQKSETGHQPLLQLSQTADMFLGTVKSAAKTAYVFRDKPKTPLQYCEATAHSSESQSQDSDEFHVQHWVLTSKVSIKDRWQIFTATEHMLFSAAQNAATIGCWIKGPSGTATAPGHIDLVATEAIPAYPHQIESSGDTVVIGGRDFHYDDAKQQIPTAIIVVVDIIDGGRGYRQRAPIHVKEFDAVAQLSVNQHTAAATGFPRNGVSFDPVTGKRKVDLVGQPFTVILLDTLTWDRSLDRKVLAHDDVISRVILDDSMMFTASFDNTVKQWHVPAQGEVQSLRVLQCSLPTSIVPQPSITGAFITASLDGVIRWWRPDSTDPVATIDLADESAHLVTPLSIASDGNLLLTSHFGKCAYDPDQFCGIAVWDTERVLAISSSSKSEL